MTRFHLQISRFTDMILTKFSQSAQSEEKSPYHQLKFDIQHIGSYFTLKIKHIFVIRSSGRLEQKDGPSNMSCHVKYSARITKRVASVQRTDIFRLAHVNYTYKKHQEDDIISSLIFQIGTFFQLLPAPWYNVFLQPQNDIGGAVLICIAIDFMLSWHTRRFQYSL